MIIFYWIFGPSWYAVIGGPMKSEIIPKRQRFSMMRQICYTNGLSTEVNHLLAGITSCLIGGKILNKRRKFNFKKSRCPCHPNKHLHLKQKTHGPFLTNISFPTLCDKQYQKHFSCLTVLYLILITFDLKNIEVRDDFITYFSTRN